uniref:Serine/threonine-protein kinase ATR n=8 Tax=Wuchereria bancrofti TaxID=6293 RepID=A0AAF5Q436_WUCBA
MELNKRSKQEQQQSEKEGFEYIDILLENLEQRRLFANDENSSIHFSLNDVYMLYKVVAEEFSEKLHQSILNGDNVEHLTHFPDLLEVYCTADRNLQTANVISDEQIIWTIGEFISVLSSPIVYKKFGGLYQDCIIELIKLLRPPDILFVQKQIVLILKDVVDKKSHLVYNINSDQGQVIFATPMGDIVLGPVMFTINYLSGSDSIIQDVLLSILQHGTVDESIMQNNDVLIYLWFCLLHVILIGVSRVKNKAILLTQRLLSMDACNPMFADLLFDDLMAVERWLYHLAPEIIGNEELRLKEALETCERTFGDAVRNIDECETFNRTDFSYFLKWTKQIAEICSSHVRPDERLVNMLIDLCSVNLRVEKSVREQCCVLSTYLYTTVKKIFQCELQIKAENVGELFEFIFVVLEHNDINSSLLLNELTEQLAFARQRYAEIEMTKYLRIREMMIVALKQILEKDKSNFFIAKIIPETAEVIEIIENISNMPDVAKETLAALISLISSFTECVEKEADFWLAELVADLKRFDLALPALSQIYKLSLRCSQYLSPDIKASTIPALGHLNVCPEWRRKVYISALTSAEISLLRTAVEHFPSFIFSTDRNEFEFLLNHVLYHGMHALQEDDKAELCSAVLKAVARTLCFVSMEKRLADDEICMMCRGKQIANRNLEMNLDKIFELIKKAVHGNNAAKLGCCELLASLLNHISFSVLKKYEAEMHCTLILMKETDEDLRSEFQWCLKPMMELKLENVQNEVMQVIGDLQKLPKTFDNFKLHAIFCLTNSQNDNLFLMCLNHLLNVAIVSDYAFVVAEIKHAIEDRMEKYAPNLHPRQWFLRKKKYIMENLTKRIIFEYSERTKPLERETVDERFEQSIEYSLNVLVEIFDFPKDDIESFMGDACPEIVTSLLLDCMAEKEKVQMALDTIARLRRVQPEILMEESLPLLLVKHLFKDLSIQVMQNALNFISFYTKGGCNWSTLVSKKAYECTVCLLQHLCVHEEKAMMHIKNLHKLTYGRNCPFSFTAFIRESYLGILLHFRQAISDDRFYDERLILVSSLCKVMAMIKVDGTDFLDQTADKMLIVLRAFTPLGIVVIEIWKVYLKTLSDEVLVKLLPQTLVSIIPLLRFEQARELLRYIFEERQLHFAANGDFERIALVFWNNPKISINEYLSPKLGNSPPELVFHACASLLKESYEEVGEVILHKLLSLLNEYRELADSCFDNIAAELVPSLLQIIRKSSLSECRYLASLALGCLGAVDPGRIGLSLACSTNTNVDQHNARFVFVDSGEQFYIELLERAAVAFSGILDASMQVECSYSIQTVLRELFGRHGSESSNLWDMLSDQCRSSLSMLRKSSFILHKPLQHLPTKRPIIECEQVKDFRSWLNLWYKITAAKIRHEKLKIFFGALEGLVNADIVFAGFILPQLILQSIIEHNLTCMNEVSVEITAVLQKSIIDSGWPRSAAHLIFAVIDCLEQFTYHRRSQKIPADMVLQRTLEILSNVTTQTASDGNCLIVAAAGVCHCTTRALKWCEQYAIGCDAYGQTLFKPDQFSFLEKIYFDLGDMDGVAGAFETIRSCAEPTINDRILSLEADGNYWDALPLYRKSTNVEPSYTKCLLRLNEPRLALSGITDLLKRSESVEFQEKLRSCQLEAMWQLQLWDDLTDLLYKKPKTTTCGATYATIICTLRNQQFNLMDDYLVNARMRLADALTAMTIEDSDTYTQAYKTITQLHILSEIEDAKSSLKLENGEILAVEDLAKVLNVWQKRAAKAIQSASVLEPILNARRSLLSLLEGDIGRGSICDLFLQSCRLARHDGHLQVAWSYLIQAKDLNINQFEVEMEEARYLFQKGSQVQAIQILSNLLKRHFSDEMQQLKNISCEGRDVCCSEEEYSGELRRGNEDFVKAQLLFAEYSLRAGAGSYGDFYKTYFSLPLIAEPSEDLFYRVAIFFDKYLYSKNENAEANNVTMILKAYRRVLKHGKRYLFHVMPRMLSIWLDYTQKMAENGSTQLSSKVHARGLPLKCLSNEDKCVREMNGVIYDGFKCIDHYMFYTAFAQLISRITHPNEDVFQTLKMILSTLMVEYPHQCLWQSIAVFRCDADNQPLRFTRCRAVYDLAKRTDETGQLKNLIPQYEYVAAAFIRVAEDNCPIGTQSPFSQRYTYLSEYFRSGKMSPTIWTTERAQGKETKEPVRPSIVVPLHKMIEQVIPTNLNTLSQLPDVNLEQTVSSASSNIKFSTTYIHSIDEEFTVMKSLVRPKKITIVGSDGKKYPLMCKAKDELRKDARLMDFNRMVNALLHQNADARRRQLHVRTYNVIPLQDAGGLIEWIPNLQTYRSVVEQLVKEKCNSVMTDKEWFSRWIHNGTDEEKLARLRTEYYPRHPIVMPEWFRRSFSDSCHWYAARLAFTYTSAVMSMVGFILGLGDRHGENLLLDLVSGDAIHVDFNLLFNKGENLNVPEVVPFRLTRNIVAGFGATGVEGAFRRSCETTMRVLREHDEALLTVLQTFVHDPLLEWMHSESRAQQYKQRKRNDAKLSPPVVAQQQAQEAIDMIRSRLIGHIITPKIYRTETNNPPMSIEGQVGRLIDISRDELNLARMYIGWCPFI